MLSLGASLALAACHGRGPVPAPGRSAAQSPFPPAGELAASVDQALDQLEERLLADQATVRFWREMRDRHESVTAIATVNAERHGARGGVVEERPRERAEPVPKRRRLAARTVPSGQGGP